MFSSLVCELYCARNPFCELVKYWKNYIEFIFINNPFLFLVFIFIYCCPVWYLIDFQGKILLSSFISFYLSEIIKSIYVKSYELLQIMPICLRVRSLIPFVVGQNVNNKNDVKCFGIFLVLLVFFWNHCFLWNLVSFVALQELCTNFDWCYIWRLTQPTA